MDPIYVGWLSLIPPILAISLALITKEVISSLLIGILSGTLIYAIKLQMNPIVDTAKFTFDLMADKVDIYTLLFLGFLGALVVTIGMAGGTKAYGRWARTKLKTKRSAMLATGFLGVAIFIDDYFNCLTVGTVMKPITDKYKVSRAKLAYIIDATAAPICIIAPVSSWVVAVGSYIAATEAFDSEIMAFMATVPYNLYALLSLLMVVILCVTDLDFGPMAKAEARAKKGLIGAVEAEELKEEYHISEKGKVSDMLIPVFALIIITVLAMLENGGFFGSDPEYHSFVAAFGNCDASQALCIGGFGALLVAFVMFVPRKLMSLKQFMEGVTKGVQSMVPAYLILILAWTISGVCRDLLLTGEYVKVLVERSALPVGFLPILIFLVAAALAFAMGTAWGTFGILIPIVVAACGSLAPELTIVSLSATLAGSVFGDHCSPISDTTILSSAGAGCDHIEHVSTQMPYACTVAACSGVGYLVSGFTGGNLWLTWGSALACMGLVIFILNRRTGTKVIS